MLYKLNKQNRKVEDYDNFWLSHVVSTIWNVFYQLTSDTQHHLVDSTPILNLSIIESA